VQFEQGLLVPWLRPLWQATNYPCKLRLVTMLREWIPTYKQHELRSPVTGGKSSCWPAGGRSVGCAKRPTWLSGIGRVSGVIGGKG